MIQAFGAQFVSWLEWAWAIIHPHKDWIGGVVAVAMGFWRWYDKRESVVFGRLNRLLRDEINRVRESCQYALTRIIRPGPSAHPQPPQFSVSSLRKLFARMHWFPVLAFAGVNARVDKKLTRAHELLNRKDEIITNYRTFADEQRYSTFLLQGAVAATRASQAENEADRIRLDSEAMDRFDDALRVPSKNSDVVVLELKALQLRKLCRPADASLELSRAFSLVKERLSGATPLHEKDNRSLSIQLIRLARYLAEIDHQNAANGNANGRLLALLEYDIFKRQLDGRDLLERAQFHEVHACIRAGVWATRDDAGNFSLPAGGVAAQSIAASEADYRTLLGQLNPMDRSVPVRFWRWLWRLDHKDGTAELRQLAAESIARLAAIKAGRGCNYCQRKTSV